jgi:4-nitrophenyl phosphatase
VAADRVDGATVADIGERLGAARGFLFDLDGTLVLGDRHNRGLRPLPGALEITRWVAERGLPFAVLTNGTTKTPQQLGQALRDIGFEVGDQSVLTPASSAVSVLTRRGFRRVLALGGEGLTGPLREAGIDVLLPTAGRWPASADPGSADQGRADQGRADQGRADQGRADPGSVDAVLVGWFPDFSLATLEAACHAVWSGAQLYSASQSLYFATAEGRAIGTSRAISAMITSLTGRRARLVGKPSLAALRTAAARMGVRTGDLVVVGDDPELEVPMAHRGRSLAVAVTSGLGHAGSFSHLPRDRQPHLHLRGVDELLEIVTSG